MAKVLRCSELMPFCKAVIEGEDVEEVMAKAAEHVQQEHCLPTLPPDVAQKARAAIKDD